MVVSHRRHLRICALCDLFKAFAHLFAFPAAYFSSLKSSAYIPSLASVTHEVKLMLGQPVSGEAAPTNLRFGAKDVMDLNWKNLLDAYSCTECGRCTDQCPANQTGKLLSPRKIMMDTRDRLEEVGVILSKIKANLSMMENHCSIKLVGRNYVLAPLVKRAWRPAPWNCRP